MPSTTRPCSPPPPRMESPQLLPTPLPLPHVVHRQRSQPQLHATTSTPQRPPRSSHRAMPSMDALPRATKLNSTLWPDCGDFGTKNEKTSPPTLPVTPPREHIPGKGYHRRNLSISISPKALPPVPRSRTRSRSPPPPFLREPPPPVPPIPAYLLSAGGKKTILLRPKSSNNRPVPIIIPPLNFCDSDSDSDVTPPSSAHRLQAPAVPRASSQEAMTCLKFFALHNSQDPKVNPLST
ncbi:uncharacterized protein STEHIDRAFT_167696 [Stereum hirsutum FP-91666 SS1]|uniref:uncharacterized protein n=1 Tax=Stereum hirsutum (strain FP-91666) TaxID=721885 RepID=UPI000440B900|nr:uncharacterized protein STEHIDRAFT_167696 [Stereum hirsutum FP-91666 SS1]EIM88397.1 hypothetical protein STEHIDRAFT_167696 [Stereum hirsutum FP-91666 SS1]